MRNLHDRPKRFVPFLALMSIGLGVFHLVGELEERVFDVFEAWGWGLAVAAGGAHWWHGVGARWSGLFLLVGDWA
jgi:hypothetical protein